MNSSQKIEIRIQFLPDLTLSGFDFSPSSIILFQIENLEELLKEKDNQVEIARSKLSAVQAQTYSSEGALSSLEEALADRDKQVRRLFSSKENFYYKFFVKV